VPEVRWRIASATSQRLHVSDIEEILSQEIHIENPSEVTEVNERTLA
jgi:hypothetical protein